MGELLGGKFSKDDTDLILGDFGFEAYRLLAEMAAKATNSWAGVPVALPDLPLVIEPRYPFQGLDGAYLTDTDIKNADNTPDPTIINRFWSSKYRSHVYVVRDPITQKSYAHWVPYNSSGSRELCTIGAAIAWTIETETKALEKLKTLITPHMFSAYFLTGSFLETSKRSNVIYLFRKLRPTIAMNTVNGMVRILCAMCMHPIGYYSGSWAGCMTPTDDVIAHLLMMRGDERNFWSKANQHPAYYPEAGIY